MDILPRDAEPTTDFCIAHRGLMEQTGNVGIFAPVFLFVHHCLATNVNELLRETHYTLVPFGTENNYSRWRELLITVSDFSLTFKECTVSNIC